jgi:methyl-accepting chemotaxis protein
MQSIDNQTIQLVIIGVAALAVVLQAVVLIAILIALKKAATSMHRDIQELRISVLPVLTNSRDFLTRVAPKIESTTNDVAEIVHTVREKTIVLESTVTAILDRAQRQSAQLDGMMTSVLERTQRQTVRVDGMVTSALDSVDKVSGFVSNTVSKPVRQISAFVAAARAVVHSLNETAPHSPSAPGPGDHDPSA